MSLSNEAFKPSIKITLNKKQKREILVVKKKISNKEFKYEKLKECPTCKSNQKIKISEYDRYGFPYKSNLCKGCGLIYTSPRFNQESYIKFYNYNYRNIYSEGGTKDKFYQNQVVKGIKVFSFLSNHIDLKRIKNILEVGSGMGGILAPFKEKGKKVLGVDYGSEYVNYGNGKGINSTLGGIKNIKKTKFDLIIYCHVFEHILDLDNELNEIKKRLSKRGVLYIEVPGIKALGENYRNDLNRYLQNAHTYNFSLITLCNVLNKNGFKLKFGNERVESIFVYSGKPQEIVNEYKTILNQLNNYAAINIKYLMSIKYVKNITIAFLRKIKLYGLIESLRNFLIIYNFSNLKKRD